MAIKLVDELKAMGNFPIAHAEGINLVKTDGTEDNLQSLFDNGELGGGDDSVTLTQQEYEALSEEQKLDGLYYTYDTKRIYKNGVQYGASDAEGIGYNNAESGIQATTVQGAIDKVVKTVEDAYAKKTDIPTTLPANGGNADTVNNHTVKSDVPENAKFTDTVLEVNDTDVSETTVWSSKKTSGEIAEKIDKTDIATTIDNTVTDEQIASARAVLRSKSATRMDESVNPENYEVGAWFAEGHDSISLSTSDGHPCSEWHIGYVVTGYKASDSNGYKIILAIAMSGNCYIKVQQWDKWTDWKELATMDKVETTQIIGFKTNRLNQCYGYYTIGNNKVSVHMKFVLSSALGDWETLTNANLPAPSSAVTKNANGKTGAPNSVYINTEGRMQQGGGGGMSAGTYEFDFEYTTA